MFSSYSQPGAELKSHLERGVSLFGRLKQMEQVPLVAFTIGELHLSINTMLKLGGQLQWGLATACMLYSWLGSYIAFDTM